MNKSHLVEEAVSAYKIELEASLDEYFPKGKCEERGAALLLFASAILMFRRSLPTTLEAAFNRGREEMATVTEQIEKAAYVKGQADIIQKLRGEVEALKDTTPDADEVERIDRQAFNAALTQVIQLLSDNSQEKDKLMDKSVDKIAPAKKPCCPRCKKPNGECWWNERSKALPCGCHTNDGESNK